MTDIALLDRGKKIGDRIKTERKVRKWSQEELGEKIGNALSEKAMSQNTISNWETGNAIPSIEKILVMSKLFGCDCGYLLCDYDNRTHDSLNICESTGLSERSVNVLTSLKTWDVNDVSRCIDFLLLDVSERHVDHNFRSVLDLLNFFLSYKDQSDEQINVSINGHIYQDHSTDGTVSTSAIRINGRIVENAVLSEILQALISLKEKCIKAASTKRGNNNG